MTTIGRKIQNRFKNFWLRLVGGATFRNFLLPFGPLLTKMKKKSLKFECSKIQKN